jgi:RNA polymerase sigma-70 factor (ECF subfamily)
MTERRLIDAACRGDEAAFQRLMAPLRGPLHAHCQRMLGSAHDADDAMQDVLLRAWRALPRFEGRSTLHSWLYRIATNICLTVLARRPKRVALEAELDDERGEYPSGDGENPTAAGYEEQEAAALAFAVTLRRLPARQRAALILRDVLGFPADEAALILGTSVASVNSALQRARGSVCAEPDAPPAGERLDDAVRGFLAALARGDVETLIGIAADPALSAERSWSYSPVPAY